MLWNTPQWKRFRITILERDGYTCQLAQPGCTGTATSVHHILPAATYTAGWYDPDNCISVCTRCHGRTDGKRSKSQGGGALAQGVPRPDRSYEFFTDSQAG
jgi:5-methylcytosine-specific restriction endonuclease McrA